MAISAGQTCYRSTDAMGRGWLMFGAAMAVGTTLLIEQRIACCDCRNNLSSCALMAGDTCRMTIFGIGNLGSMTISTEQATD